MILPHLVVLVEVKSRRLGPAARAGDATLMNSLSETLGGARKQLTRTVSHLADNHPAFTHIPTDRPMLGLIVTAEPFYTGAHTFSTMTLRPSPAGGSRCSCNRGERA